MESPFGKMNQERTQREYDNIKLQMVELNGLLERKNNGAQDLDEEINSLAYGLRSSVREFIVRNPNSPLSDELKNLVGLN